MDRGLVEKNFWNLWPNGLDSVSSHLNALFFFELLINITKSICFTPQYVPCSILVRIHRSLVRIAPWPQILFSLVFKIHTSLILVDIFLSRATFVLKRTSISSLQVALIVNKRSNLNFHCSEFVLNTLGRLALIDLELLVFLYKMWVGVESRDYSWCRAAFLNHEVTNLDACRLVLSTL